MQLSKIGPLPAHSKSSTCQDEPTEVARVCTDYVYTGVVFEALETCGYELAV